MTIKLEKKMSTCLESLEFYKLFDLNAIKFYFIKLVTDLYWQPSYLLGERASLNSGMGLYPPYLDNCDINTVSRVTADAEA